MKRISKKTLLFQVDILKQEVDRQRDICNQVEKENDKLRKLLKEKEELEAYKTMLPTSIYDNNVYNTLLDWVKSCEQTGIAIKVDNSEKIIYVYTPNPGILIGPHGKTIEQVENKIRSYRFYENYKIHIYEITMLISKNDKKITDEEHRKNWESLMEYRFGQE